MISQNAFPNYKLTQPAPFLRGDHLDTQYETIEQLKPADIERNLLNINSEQFMQTIHIFFGPTAESKREFAFEEE